MIKGIEIFKNTFSKFPDSYILIGGAACDVQLEQAGMPFRVTRDLDIVLCVESLTPEFGRTFWDFIRNGKRVEIGLTYIYGIGLTTSKKILAETGINPDTRVKDLDENDVSKLREYIDHNLRVEGELRSEVSLNIKRLMEIGCYRGIRHRKGLPVRGQSTKRNARTRKGPARAIAGKKK